MSARISEKILPYFTVDAEGLRNLNAVLVERCKEIDDQVSLEYEVRRKDALNYTTQSIEDICKERNGNATRIESIGISSKNSGTALDLTVSLDDDGLRISLAGEDRAKIMLLAGDIRALANDRMRSAGLRANIKFVPFFIGTFFILMIMLFAFVAVYDNLPDPDLDAARDQYSRRQESLVGELKRAGTLDEKLNYLLDESIPGASPRLGEFPRSNRPDATRLISDYFLFVMIGMAALSSALFWLARTVFRPLMSTFLIGDGINRHARSEKRREQLIWSVGAALVVGILSGVIVAWLNL